MVVSLSFYFMTHLRTSETNTCKLGCHKDLGETPTPLRRRDRPTWLKIILSDIRLILPEP